MPDTPHATLAAHAHAAATAPTPPMSRRGLLKMSGFALGALAAAPAILTPARDALAADPFKGTAKVTAAHPLRICYNENALGMSPKARAAAAKALLEANRYPFEAQPALREVVAAYHKVTPDHLLLTPGSSDAIRGCVAAYAAPGTQLVIPELTYGDGEMYGRINRLDVVKVPSDRETWAIDLEGMKNAVAAHGGPSIVYLVNPNNPTSTVTDSATVDAWIRSKPKDTVFFIDEAYAEFVNDPSFHSADRLVASGLDNVVILKTFSKIHGMAGLRTGYAVAVPPVVARVKDHVENDSMTLTAPAIAAATASMRDAAHLALSKRCNDQARAVLTGALDELGWRYLPSEANFVFHRVPGSLADYQRRMRDANILVGRAFPPADGWCRVSLGTPAEMRALVKVMKAQAG
ncbi:MAG: histidinol-phosphate aminotransferase family protein [Acidobacteriota bacterium]|nr:histidinol-phosphate aminotransferase family protein [Acidobacteriota bacterium]